MFAKIISELVACSLPNDSRIAKMLTPSMLNTIMLTTSVALFALANCMAVAKGR